MKKRFFAMFLIVSIVLSLVPASAATVPPDTKSDPDIVNGHNINIIPSNVAEALALIFVNSNVDAGLTTTWTTETIVSDVIPMFDENGVPTAFSVELNTNGTDTGYIVISAYPDVESYILEYADTAEPLYKDLSVSPIQSIVYTDTMSYMKDDGSGSLIDLQGQKVDRKDVMNTFEDMRDSTVFEAKKDVIIEIFQNEPTSPTRSAYDQYGAIVDPIAYIDDVYGGGAYCSAYEWKNTLGTYTNHRIMDVFHSVYPGFNCGPTALTNLIETAGNYYNISAIKNKSITTLYSNIESIGVTNNWFGYDYTDDNGNSVYGTFWVYMDDYLNAALNYYGVSHQSVSTLLSSSLSYDIIKQKIEANQFCILGVLGHSTYQYHFVYPYAYTRFKNSQTGYYKSFLKVADGWSSSGRYIDMSKILNSDPTNPNSYFYSVAIS